MRMRGLELEVVALGNGVTEKDLIVHDERHPNPAYAFLLSRMETMPGFPTPARRAARGATRRATRPGQRADAGRVAQARARATWAAAPRRRHLGGEVSHATCVTGFGGWRSPRAANPPGGGGTRSPLGSIPSPV